MAKEIPLTQGQVTIVYDEDYEWLNQWKWYAFRDKKLQDFYAVRGEQNRTVFMHREIMNTPKGMMTDHINNNPLDNRRENLRIVTNRQNQQNRHNKGTSKYPGVCWNVKDKQWRAKIKINGITKHLGQFNDEIDAAKAYEQACRELVGEELVCKAHLKNEGR